MVTKHSFCHKLPCASNRKTSFTKVKQLVAFRKVILLKPLNKQKHHQKLCTCMLCMLKFKVTTMVLALFFSRHCLYDCFATFSKSEALSSCQYCISVYVCMCVWKIFFGPYKVGAVPVI